MYDLTEALSSAEPASTTTSSPSNVKIIVPVVVASAAAALAALAGYLTWRLRRKEPLSTALSRTALLKLSNSTRQDLKFEFQKGGSPMLIGKGGFGEVGIMAYVTLLS